MITPSTFSNQGYQLAEMFFDIQIRLLTKMSRQLNKGLELTPSDWKTLQLSELSTFVGNREEIIKEATKINKELGLILDDAFKKGIKESDNIAKDLKSLGSIQNEVDNEIDFYKASIQKLEVIIKDTQRASTEALINLYGQVGTKYQETINRALLGGLTGSETLKESVNLATQELAEQGVGYVTYKGGRKVSTHSYIEMVTRTVSNKVSQQAITRRNKEYGYSLVKISEYMGCSEICQPWQGRVYFDDVDGGVNNTSYPSLSSAIEQGLFHPNCKHHKYSYDPEVQDYEPPMEVNPELYQAEQEQRYNERMIRQWKQRNAVANDKTKTSLKVKEWQKKNQELIKTNDNLRRDYGGEQI